MLRPPRSSNLLATCSSRSQARALLAAAFGLLTGVMFGLPFWRFPGYSLLRHTTSHLGAQGSPHAWVMNLTFAVLGHGRDLGQAGAVATKVAPYRVHLVLAAAFGLSLVLVGLFQHEPMVDGISGSDTEALLHSVFATSTGVSFVGLSVATAFISAGWRPRLLAAALGFGATGLSLAMATWPDLMGLFQRAMFLASFAWLLVLTHPRYRLC